MIRNGIYRHFKGNYYELIGTGRHSETLEEMAIYCPLYGESYERGERAYWVRPAYMWEEEVTRDGKTFPRFAYVAATLAEVKDTVDAYNAAVKNAEKQ